MKKTKALATLLLALTFTFATATMAACSDDVTAQLPSVETENTDSSSSPDNGTTDSAGDENASGGTSNGANDSDSEPSTPTPIPTPQPQPNYAQYIKCTGNNVNLRAGAGTDYAVLGSAEKGTTYAVVGKSGQWYKTYYRGKTAYLYASYAAVLSLKTSDNEAVENVIEEGYKLLGVPYVYGAVRVHDGNGKLLSGFTTQKFDCSSLIQYIFYKGANTLLQVTTRTQVKQGKYVAKNDLRRGDCLFFTNESREHLSGVERVGHVALYLGNNYILHTASDYARIEQISNSRWNYYIEARRFL